MGSRSLQLGGSAVHEASVGLVERARQVAADALEANPDDVVLDKADGRFHVAGTPDHRSHLGRAVRGRARRRRPAVGDHRLPGRVAHLPLRRPRRGGRRRHRDRARSCCVRHIAVDDAGRILNPLLADGQRHGGIAQGAAQALLEEVRYDEDGNPVTSNLADYAAISATELPELRAGGDGDAHRP